MQEEHSPLNIEKMKKKKIIEFGLSNFVDLVIIEQEISRSMSNKQNQKVIGKNHT